MAEENPKTDKRSQLFPFFLHSHDAELENYNVIF